MHYEPINAATLGSPVLFNIPAMSLVPMVTSHLRVLSSRQLVWERIAVWTVLITVDLCEGRVSTVSRDNSQHCVITHGAFFLSVLSMRVVLVQSAL